MSVVAAPMTSGRAVDDEVGLAGRAAQHVQGYVVPLVRGERSQGRSDGHAVGDELQVAVTGHDKVELAAIVEAEQRGAFRRAAAVECPCFDEEAGRLLGRHFVVLSFCRRFAFSFCRLVDHLFI